MADERLRRLMAQVNGTDAPELAAQVAELVATLGAAKLAQLGSSSLRQLLEQLQALDGDPTVAEALTARARWPHPAPTRGRRVGTVDAILERAERDRDARTSAQTISRDPATGRLLIGGRR